MCVVYVKRPTLTKVQEGTFLKPRNPPVDTIKQRREHDGRHRPFESLFERKPDRGQARAKREQGDQVRHQSANRDATRKLPEAAAARRRVSRVEGSKRHAPNIARALRRRHDQAR